jgi:hypothetical protein
MHEIAALVVRDAETRARMAGYLKEAGFEVQAFEHAPPMATTTGTVVWVIGDDRPKETALLVRSWLASRSYRRAVLVTRWPSSVRTALQVDEARLQILVPPVFPWQLVDAVRAAKAVGR